MNPQSTASYVYVDRPAALEALRTHMSRCGRIPLDTEADSLHHYFEKVCLIQLTLDGLDYIVDPLVGLDLSRFLRVLGDKPLVLHGGEYDLRMLRASVGFRPGREVFDTLLAAQILGYEQISLVALVERFFAAALSKRGRKSNWARRPLTAAQLQYACDDTRFLEPLADALAAELHRLGRQDWHRQACERMVEATGHDQRPGPEDPWRIKGAHRLDQRQLAFVRQLWCWREEEAQRADRPPFKIMGNALLMELALWAASHPTGSLSHGPKLPRHFQGNRLETLAEAIAAARSMPESQWPRARERRHYQPEPQPEIDTLRAECARLAAELGIDPAVLAPRAALAAIARQCPRTIEETMACGRLMRWQAELLEPAVRCLLTPPFRRAAGDP